MLIDNLLLFRIYERKTLSITIHKLAPLAREDQHVFMPAIFPFHAGKSIIKITANHRSWTEDHLLNIRAPGPILPGEILIINLNTAMDFTRQRG